MSNLYEQIGQKIRELRIAYSKGSLSQEALAEHLDTASNTISRWETGTYKPTAEDLEKLAKFFGVPIATFFPGQQSGNETIQALTSATGGLDQEDLEAIIEYAEFRRARKALAGAAKDKKKRAARR